ncbi:MAG: hypothetical protein GY765_30305, partial [bacterium]|nr:hypothetical protein [bacterium]
MRNETISTQKNGTIGNDVNHGDVVVAATKNIKERDYWLKKLAGEFQKSHLPYSFKKPQGMQPAWNTATFQISGNLFEKLMRLRNGADYTLHMVLLAGVTAILERYMDTMDIIVGAPIYKQKNRGTFINTVLAL